MTTAPPEPAHTARSGRITPRPWRLASLLMAPMLVLAASCGDDEESGSPTTTSSSTTTSSTTTSSSTTTTTSSSTTTVPPTTSADGGDPMDETVRCENPEGFSVAYPQEWVVNDGSVVGPCSQFDPDPFEVPDGTDARVAAITAYVDRVAFSDVVGADPTIDGSRAVTVVDGHQAVRRSGVTSGSQLHEDGIPITRYLVDLSLGVDDGPGTLFLDTIDVTGGDHEVHRRVLDAMVATLEIEGSDSAPGVVARHEGGGAPFTVTADAPDGEICLTTDVHDGEACFDRPSEQTPIRSRVLDGDAPAILVGVAAPDVFMIETAPPDGEPFAVLPVAGEVLDGAMAWAFPFVPDTETELVWYDRSGSRGGTVDAGS